MARDPLYGRTRGKGKLQEFLRAKTIWFILKPLAWHSGDTWKVLLSKNRISWELALQLSKDSYCTKLGNYRGHKNSYKPMIQSMFIGAAHLRSRFLFSVAVRKQVWLEVPREGTILTGISLVNRSV